MINPWQVLNLNRKSTDEEIRTAYIKLVQKYHPDKEPYTLKAVKSLELFNVITEAYNTLKTKTRRNEYIDKLTCITRICSKCAGAGVSSKSKGLTEKIYKTCLECFGAGFIINTKENDDVITKLHGITRTNRAGRDKKR